MRATTAEALYRHLRLLFPLKWRQQYEADFIDTLRDMACDVATPYPVLILDLLRFALVLRWRALADACDGKGRDTATGDIASPFHVLALAVLLLIPALRWSEAVPLEFILTSILVVLVPGIGVLYTVSSAMLGGRAAGLYAAYGCTLGIVPHLLLAFVGLSGLMQLGATLFEVVRWAGVIYLIWMGIGMLRSRGTIAVTADSAVCESAGPHAIRLIARGVLVNLLNPKLTAFFFAFLPQFIDIDSIAAFDGGIASIIDMRLFVLGTLFMLFTLVGFVLYALAGAAVSGWVGRTPWLLAWLKRAFGVLILGFATRLAVAER